MYPSGLCVRSVLLLAVVFFGVIPASAQNSRDFTVLLQAEATAQPQPAITLRWEADQYAQQYSIEKRSSPLADWNTIAQPTAMAVAFTDTDVVPGRAYEYQVRKVCVQPIKGDSTLTYQGTGYIYAGIDVLPSPGRSALLLVDETMTSPLAAEIARLVQDMENEGWTVLQRSVARTEEFDGAAVQAVKQRILEAYTAAEGTLTTVFILGRVAVPYSGRIAPDGHPDHVGAWPADLFYGDINGVWTDQIINDDTSASRAANRNIIGDGKFDQSRIASDIELQVGRVDFYNMPEFPLSETELLRRYLDKNHRYRTGQTVVQPGGIVDDNFSARNYPETFASSGWRNIALFGGGASVRAADWFTTLDTAAVLWAYGCGAGSYTSAGGIGNSKQFVDAQVNAVFTMLFGSYFGDWDTKNNLLRAALASGPSILTCVWAARPHWYFHHMILGEPIGYSALISHNNTGFYIPNVNYNVPGYPNGVVYTTGNREVHMALLGDPTLRVYTGAPAPALQSLTATHDDAGVHLQWTAPSTPVAGYEVLRATSPQGPFTRVVDSIVTTTEFTDYLAYTGTLTYMVRAVHRRESGGGSYYEAGPGALHTLAVATGVADSRTPFPFVCSPSPADHSTVCSLFLAAPTSVDIDVFDIHGARVLSLFSGTLAAGTHTVAWDLAGVNGARVPSGVYLVRCNAGGQVVTAGVTVLP